MRTGLFFALVLAVCACDLNHNWKETSTASIRDLSAPITLALMQEALKDQKSVYVIEMSDVYKQKGTLSVSASAVATRTSNEVTLLEKSLWQENSPLKRLPESFRKLDLYKPGQLAALAKDLNCELFARIKIRRYNIILRHQEDQYTQNQHVKRDSKEHQLDLTIALVRPDGSYLDFIDRTVQLEEFRVYHKPPGAKENLISEQFLGEQGLVLRSRYLGLEHIREMGASILRLKGLI